MSNRNIREFTLNSKKIFTKTNNEISKTKKTDVYKFKATFDKILKKLVTRLIISLILHCYISGMIFLVYKLICQESIFLQKLLTDLF